MCLYLLMVWYLDLIKEKSASKIILVRLWEYHPTYLEWKRVLKVFPLCAQMIIKSYWVFKLSKNISKEIISSACLESKTCCLVFNDTKNFIQRTKLTEIYSPIVGLYFDRQKCYWRAASIIWLKRWYHENILNDF